MFGIHLYIPNNLSVIPELCRSLKCLQSLCGSHLHTSPRLIFPTFQRNIVLPPFFQILSYPIVSNRSIVWEKVVSNLKSGEKRKLREILTEGYLAFKNEHFVCTIDEINGCKYRQQNGKYQTGNFIRHIRSAPKDLTKSRGLLQEDGNVPIKKRKVS